MKRWFASVVGFCLCLSVAGVLQAAVAKSPAQKPRRGPVLMASKNLKWTPVPAMPGMKEAVLWGDPKKGSYGALEMLQAGTGFPLHTHAHDMKFVVCSGTLVVKIKGEEPQYMGSGSYGFIPGGVQHVTQCTSTHDCVFLNEQSGAADYMPAVRATHVKPVATQKSAEAKKPVATKKVATETKPAMAKKAATAKKPAAATKAAAAKKAAPAKKPAAATKAATAKKAAPAKKPAAATKTTAAKPTDATKTTTATGQGGATTN